MNKNIIVVLGGAILAAVLVAVLVQVTLGGKKASIAPIENSVEVLVAAQDLKAGKELEEGDMRWSEWSQDALFKGVVVRKGEEAADSVLKGRLERSFVEGEALSKRSLLSETQSNSVSARLKEGERAVSVKVSGSGMVAGFITPGSYVDVILTYKHRVPVEKDEPSEVKDMVNMNIKSMAVETILENIRVLAIDQKAVQKDDDKIKIGKTVTFAVSIRDAEKLALASEMGVLTLVMRGVGDDKPNSEEGEMTSTLTDARLTSIDDEIRAASIKLKEESGVNTDFVKIYNGANVQVAPVH